MKLSPEQIAEIRHVKEKEQKTRRECASSLEETLYEPIPVLDKGFIRVIDYMGNDSSIVQAARVSYGKGTKKESNDRGLIRYLMRHRHTTPFEMCEIKFHVKLPIFVARQWIRHRTANVNEYSARYSILDKEFYVPDLDYLKALKAKSKIEKEEKKGQSDMFSEGHKKESIEIAAQSTKNKQGREEFLSEEEARDSIGIIKSETTRAYTNYLKLLNEEEGRILDKNKKGLARELARIVLPTNYYTQWYWKIDLHNLLHFLSLRADEHAQYEIRMYAEKMCEIVKKWVPLTWESFEDYRQGGAYFSSIEVGILKRLIAGQKVSYDDEKISKREWNELMKTLGTSDK